MNTDAKRLVVVSNRLPVVLDKDTAGDWCAKPGAGGLVSALLPVLRHRGGMWIGWPGTSSAPGELDAALAAVAQDTGYTLEPVTLSAEQVQNFYQGFSNEIIWPLFHDLQSLCNFDPAYWRAYGEVNQRYAEVIARNSRDSDFIWVHDYHLMSVAQNLHQLGNHSRTAFFLHIPFPPLDIYVKLPWRFQFLRALLEYDLIGFQTLRDRRNFVQCLRTLIPEVSVQGKGQILTIQHGERTVRVGSFPISIDYNTFEKDAGTPEVSAKTEELRSQLSHRQMILGVDRLDYTKGIPQRLLAFRHFLQNHPDMHDKVTLAQVIVPSREDIPRYHELKTQIERLVSEINGQFTRPGGWVPIHYAFRCLTRTELLAYYRAANVALVTPLKDGMNLVAKEYCACSLDEDRALILSEFAGAAAELQRDALLVNPNDVEGVSAALHQALTMPPEERRARMRRLRRIVREHDIFWWVDSYLRAAIAKDLSAFPQPADYVPQDIPADITI